MTDQPDTKSKHAPKLQLVTIASSDNPELLISALTYPQAASGPITFDTVRPDTRLQPFSWWVLKPVTADRTVFQILFHPSDRNLCLAASAASANSALVLSKVDPKNQLQLWQLKETQKGGQLIACRGAPGMQFGFSNDIPLQDMAIQIVAAPDTHETGDKFEIAEVALG